GHHLKIFRNPFRVQIRERFFSRRVINDWNSIPTNVVGASSLAEFRRKVNVFFNSAEGCPL
ncbi:MAG: hypothetical protein AAFY98_12450, partial [Verrucomicrobiota bacterium]